MIEVNTTPRCFYCGKPLYKQGDSYVCLLCGINIPEYLSDSYTCGHCFSPVFVGHSLSRWNLDLSLFCSNPCCPAYDIVDYRIYQVSRITYDGEILPALFFFRQGKLTVSPASYHSIREFYERSGYSHVTDFLRQIYNNQLETGKAQNYNRYR